MTNDELDPLKRREHDFEHSVQHVIFNAKVGTNISNGEVSNLNEEVSSQSESSEEKNTVGVKVQDNQSFVSDTVKVYKRRWLMLFIFSTYSFSNNYQWIHLNIIGNIVIRYYNASLPSDSFQRETAIDWLSMVYMLAYIPLIIPATWFLEKKGLRITLIIGAFLNALGAWLKCACVSPDRFVLLMVAQVICAIAQVFILGIPSSLAAAWFGPRQVSTATAIGVFGNQVGCATGFLVAPLLVPNIEELDTVGHYLGLMFYTGAGFTTAILISIIIVFRPKPPLPPSQAHMFASRVPGNRHYQKSIKNLFKNKNFTLLFITYGLNAGCYYAIGTLMNPVILQYFPNAEKSAGLIGLTLILSGILGSIVSGFWLDFTKAFKATTLAVYIFSMGATIVYTFTISSGRIWAVFINAGTLGFFMTGFLPVGFEFAAELTYPEAEGTSSGLLNASAQSFGIVMTIGMRTFLNKVSVFAANITVACVLLVGVLLTALIKADYRRQKAENRVKYNEYAINEELKQL